MLTELVHRHLVTQSHLTRFVSVWGCLESAVRAMPSEVLPNLNSIVLPIVRQCREQLINKRREQLIPVNNRQETSIILNPTLTSALTRFRSAYDICLYSSPPEALLKALTVVLENLVPDDDASELLTNFLRVFCQWIPHSVLDATFEVLVQPHSPDSNPKFTPCYLCSPHSLR